MLKDHLFKTTGFSALKSCLDFQETGLWLEIWLESYFSDFLRGNCKDDDNDNDDDISDNEDDDVKSIN